MYSKIGMCRAWCVYNMLCQCHISHDISKVIVPKEKYIAVYITRKSYNRYLLWHQQTCRAGFSRVSIGDNLISLKNWTFPTKESKCIIRVEECPILHHRKWKLYRQNNRSILANIFRINVYVMHFWHEPYVYNQLLAVNM